MHNDTFKEFVLDQLSALPDVRAKAMFGGHGLYCGERFFGILIEGRLYFKTNESTRAPYVGRGMKPFTYTKAKRILSMSYYEVPPDILEDRERLLIWANESVSRAALRVKQARSQRKRA